MRKSLVMSVVLVLVVALAMPVFALEVKWGGLFRARVISQSDFTGIGGDYGYGNKVDLAMPAISGFDRDGNAIANNWAGVAYTPHLNRFDQRIRMFIDFISSENLKVVTKWEANTVWGDSGSGNPSDIVGGGNAGADVNNLGMKNVYLDFKVPNTSLNAKVGVQGINLIDSWVIDSDFSSALLVADLKPFTVILGYVGGLNYDTAIETENVDDLALVVAYKEGPFSAMLVGLWQDAHNTAASVFPTVKQAWDDPMYMNVPYSRSLDNGLTSNLALASPYLGFLGPAYAQAQNNQLFDLGLQLGYKIDYLSAYLNFVKNFGSVDLALTGTPTAIPLQTFSADYTGWMIDAGVNYFCGPFTANIGGFYTTGQELDFNGPVVTPTDLGSRDGMNIETFTYPLTTSKYFSEIMGGGILDNMAPNGGYWRGYPNPTNIWTLTAGASWQALPQTKLSLSYWYFGTSEKVPSEYDWVSNTWSTDNYLGSEIDFYITQNIVDKLNLDLVGAYMFTGDAFRAKMTGPGFSDNQDDAYELGARLQWAF